MPQNSIRMPRYHIYNATGTNHIRKRTAKWAITCLALSLTIGLSFIFPLSKDCIICKHSARQHSSPSLNSTTGKLISLKCCLECIAAPVEFRALDSGTKDAVNLAHAHCSAEKTKLKRIPIELDLFQLMWKANILMSKATVFVTHLSIISYHTLRPKKYMQGICPNPNMCIVSSICYQMENAKRGLIQLGSAFRSPCR